jgi:hypothetical protein
MGYSFQNGATLPAYIRISLILRKADGAGPVRGRIGLRQSIFLHCGKLALSGA